MTRNSQQWDEAIDERVDQLVRDFFNEGGRKLKVQVSTKKLLELARNDPDLDGLENPHTHIELDHPNTEISPHLQQDHKVVVLAYMARQKGLLNKAEKEVLRVLSVTDSSGKDDHSPEKQLVDKARDLLAQIVRLQAKRENDPMRKRDYEVHHVRLLHTLAQTAHKVEARRYAEYQLTEYKLEHLSENCETQIERGDTGARLLKELSRIYDDYKRAEDKAQSQTTNWTSSDNNNNNNNNNKKNDKNNNKNNDKNTKNNNECNSSSSSSSSSSSTKSSSNGNQRGSPDAIVMTEKEKKLGYTKNSVRMQHVQNTLVKWRLRLSNGGMRNAQAMSWKQGCVAYHEMYGYRHATFGPKNRHTVHMAFQFAKHLRPDKVFKGFSSQSLFKTALKHCVDKTYAENIRAARDKLLAKGEDDDRVEDISLTRQMSVDVMEVDSMDFTHKVAGQTSEEELPRGGANGSGSKRKREK